MKVIKISYIVQFTVNFGESATCTLPMNTTVMELKKSPGEQLFLEGPTSFIPNRGFTGKWVDRGCVNNAVGISEFEYFLRYASRFGNFPQSTPRRRASFFRRLTREGAMASVRATEVPLATTSNGFA